VLWGLGGRKLDEGDEGGKDKLGGKDTVVDLVDEAPLEPVLAVANVRNKEEEKTERGKKKIRADSSLFLTAKTRVQGLP
jgi:hypothetical protein